MWEWAAPIRRLLLSLRLIQCLFECYHRVVCLFWSVVCRLFALLSLNRLQPDEPKAEAAPPPELEALYESVTKWLILAKKQSSAILSLSLVCGTAIGFDQNGAFAVELLMHPGANASNTASLNRILQKCFPKNHKGFVLSCISTEELEQFLVTNSVAV